MATLCTCHMYITAAPDQVPMVAVFRITVENNVANATLSWGEPFNNFDPIISYTVSCLGDDQCPEDFTTLDNTTRSYIIINLNFVTNYTFSVIATNSIGNGEAGVLMVTLSSCKC